MKFKRLACESLVRSAIKVNGSGFSFELSAIGYSELLTPNPEL
jgi:hypothetical protein